MVEMHPNVACSTMTVPPQLFQGLQCHAHQNGPGDVGDGEGGCTNNFPRNTASPLVKHM